MPIPHDKEEFLYNRCTTSHGIKLADSGNKQSPCNATGKAHDIGIDCPPCAMSVECRRKTTGSLTLCPELYGSQCMPKGLRLWNERKHFICHPCAIDAS